MDDIQDNFANDLKSVNFQVALDVFKKEEIILQGKKENFDLYLIERLFPVLLEGLERLSREVEAHKEKPEEVRERFNPCIFLGQYLMRNNPRHNENKKDQLQYKQIYEYVRYERFKRHFETKKQQFLKLFMTSIKKEQAHCDQNQMKCFYKDIDDKLKLNGSLNEFVNSNKTLRQLKQNVSFDNALNELTKYCSQNQNLTLESFNILF
ncbi:hypothetical protein ABPG74_010045 [Tetrahymena malaccensis]